MNKPAMMDCPLRLLRFINERKVPASVLSNKETPANIRKTLHETRTIQFHGMDLEEQWERRTTVDSSEV